MEAQLNNLASITQVIDPKLHQHLGIDLQLYFCVCLLMSWRADLACACVISLLYIPQCNAKRLKDSNTKCSFWSAETLGGGDYLFAFRMLMVLFRREFSFCDSLYLWEVRISFYCNFLIISIVPFGYFQLL